MERKERIATRTEEAVLTWKIVGHCIREEEISFELISRPLTDKAKQMDVENHQCMEGLVTNVIMSAWCLPHRPFGFMPLATLQIGHNPISPEQGHNLAAHL